MQRVNVPGGWIDFREPEDVPEKFRRRVTTMAPAAAQMAAKIQELADAGDAAAAIDQTTMSYLMEFNDAVAICLVMGWSFDVPVSVEGLLELPSSVYDVVVKHGQTNVARLLPNFSVNPDPKVLTET